MMTNQTTIVTEKRLLVLITLCFIGILHFLSLNTQQIYSSTVYKDLEENLTNTINATELSLQRWFNEQSAGVQYWARQEEIIKSSVELGMLPPDAQILINSSAQQRLRERFIPLMASLGYQGYFIVDHNLLNRASSRDVNIGITSLLQAQPDFFARMNEFGVAISLPLHSDVPLPDSAALNQRKTVTMFVGAPIPNQSGVVSSYLLFRLSVPKGFTSLFSSLSFGHSGEVFSFDRQGLLLSISRFEDELHKSGLLEPDETSQLQPLLVKAKSREPSDIASAISTQGRIETLYFFKDYRGIESVGLGRWLDAMNMGIAVKVDVEDAVGSLQTGQNMMRSMTWGGSILLLLLATLLYASRVKNWQAQSSLSAILQNSGEGIITINKQAIIETINPAAAMIFGYEVQDLIGKNINTLMPSVMRQQHDEYVHHSELYESRIINHSRDLFGLHKQGHLVPMELNVTRMNDGKEDKFIGILHDISERKQAQQELQRFKTTLDQTLDCVFMLDPHTLKYFYANQGAIKQLGYSEDELLEMTPMDINAELDEAQFRSLIAPLINGSSPSLNLETVYYHKDGNHIPVEVSLQYVAPENESPRIVAIERNISIRLEAQQHIRRSEELLQRSQAIAHVGSWEWDVNSGELLWTDETYSMLGLNKEAIVPSYDMFITYVHPEDREFLAMAINDALEGSNDLFDIKHRIIQPNGQIRYLHEVGRVDRAANGTPLKMIGVAQDITDQILIDAKLQQERRFTRSVVDSLAVHISVLDETGKIVFINEAWRRFAQENNLGTEDGGLWLNYLQVAENAQGRGSDEAPIVGNNLRAMLDGKLDSFELEYPCHAPDEQRWFLMRATRFLYQDKPTIIISHLDITERTLAERKIKQEKAAVETANSLLTITQTALGYTGFSEFWINANNGRVIRVNNQACRHLNYSREELLNMKLPDFCPEFPEESFPQLVAPMREKGWNRFESQHLTRDGQSIPVEITAMYVPAEHGNEDMLITFVTNISERKAAETELIRAREVAEIAVRAKSAFLATMSHEIRTPMNGVVGMIELLRNTTLNDDQLRMVDVVHDSSFALLRIIDDILDLSKIEAGKLQLEETRFTIADVLDSVADIMRPLAQSKHIRLYLFDDPKLEIPVAGDPVRLRQILYNLCGNAIKFTNPENGVVKLEARLLRKEEGEQRRLWVSFNVVDNGIGMSKEVTTRLFSPFYQAEASTTRRYGGTGLGLSICKNLTHMMGGEIHVDSVLHQGSTFMIELPFTVAGDSIAGAAEPSIADLAVLCLIPDEQEAANIKVYMEAYGCISHIATTEEELREAIRFGNQYDIILLYQRLEENFPSRLLRELREIISRPAYFILSVPDLDQARRFLEIDTILIENYPLKHRALRNAIASSAGRASLPVRRTDEILPVHVSAPKREVARNMGRLIMVVEDNTTNQEVILRQLWLLGYTADIAGDGREALKMWRNEPYALVLTDCHMPVMDGYQMTAAMRKEEARSGREHTPIVALTANALQGEGDKCTQCGMDGYLSKPLELKRLKSELMKWIIPLEGPTDRANHANIVTNDNGPLIHMDILAKYIGDSPAHQRQYINSFLESVRNMADELQKATARSDCTQVVILAHRIKPTAGVVGAEQLTGLFERLEVAGKEERHEDILGLQRELDLLLQQLENECTAAQVAPDE